MVGRNIVYQIYFRCLSAFPIFILQLYHLVDLVPRIQRNGKLCTGFATTLFRIFLKMFTAVIKFWKDGIDCRILTLLLLRKLLNCLFWESGWRSGHQSRLPPLRPGIESARGMRFVDLNLTPRVFLRVFRFSSLCKFDFHAKIWAVERLNISLWLGRMGNHFLRNWR